MSLWNPIVKDTVGVQLLRFLGEFLPMTGSGTAISYGGNRVDVTGNELPVSVRLSYMKILWFSTCACVPNYAVMSYVDKSKANIG
jgi:hypothetical protein